MRSKRFRCFLDGIYVVYNDEFVGFFGSLDLEIYFDGSI